MFSRWDSDIVCLEQYLQEAEERVEQEQRHTEDEQQNRKEADKRAELE
jgi:hypothetical protein